MKNPRMLDVVITKFGGGVKQRRRGKGEKEGNISRR
jgi:hypothetical protein